jgi:putative acyl-CoA dehydrogenase
MPPTHEVLNQPPPLEGTNLWEQDAALREAMALEGGAWGEERLAAYGALAGGELLELGFQANENRPVLRTHDRYGHRVDAVDFHPAYHRVMETAVAHGLHALPWTSDRPGRQVVRAALCYLHGQVEAGSCCPISMTFAAVPALRHEPAVADVWLPRLFSESYDPRALPADEKRGCTMGMGMTEKQGGSDVRASTTRAVPTGDGYAITGHKWFLSAPMCDAFLVLAQTDRGLTCFLLPRLRPDGKHNGLRLQRLKDKLGNHSNASSEVEFEDASAVRVGEEGRGVATIIEMVALTRLDCMIQSSARMRQALAQATHHAAYRKAFGKKLVDQPLMQNVLADLAVESEAALRLTLRVARAVEEGEADPHAGGFARIATAVGKYWICKRAPMQVNEAQECLGGAGYVEESILPRLYREAPLLSIWEGCGNIQCLDVLRAAVREPEALEAFVAEVKTAAGCDARLDAAIGRMEVALADPDEAERRLRHTVEWMATALQGALLVRAGNEAVAEAFCARLADGAGRMLGTLPAEIDTRGLAERARPRLAF